MMQGFTVANPQVEDQRDEKLLGHIKSLDVKNVEWDPQTLLYEAQYIEMDFSFSKSAYDKGLKRLAHKPDAIDITNDKENDHVLTVYIESFPHPNLGYDISEHKSDHVVNTLVKSPKIDFTDHGSDSKDPQKRVEMAKEIQDATEYAPKGVRKKVKEITKKHISEATMEKKFG